MKNVSAPLLETERLVLRPCQLGDFEAFAAFYASERSQYADGPVSRAVAWSWFAAGAGRWALVGYGAWTIERQEDKAAIGIVSLNHPVCDNEERELGWLLWDGFERHGYASEAASTAKDFAIDTLGWTRFVSYISEKNAASIRLAERLGAKLDKQSFKKGEPETLVYRHRSAP